MKPSVPNSKNKIDGSKTDLNDLLKKGKTNKNEGPGEEFASPDPTRSVPHKNQGNVNQDKMGISRLTKNQYISEKDASKHKK